MTSLLDSFRSLTIVQYGPVQDINTGPEGAVAQLSVKALIGGRFASQ